MISAAKWVETDIYACLGNQRGILKFVDGTSDAWHVGSVMECKIRWLVLDRCGFSHFKLTPLGFDGRPLLSIYIVPTLFSIN